MKGINAARIVALAAVLALAAAPAVGQTIWTGLSGVDATDWQDITNWDAGVPIAGTDARFVDKDGVLVDLHATNGVAADLALWGTSSFKIQGDAGVTLTVDNVKLLDSNGASGNNNNSGSPTFDVDLIVNDTIVQTRKCGGTHRYNRNLTVTNEVHTKSNTWNFGDGVGTDTITLNGGLNVTFSSINSGTTVTTNVNGTLVTPTITVGAAGTLNANSTTALGNASTNVTVQNGGVLNIGAAQAALANITLVGPYNLLAGNLTGADYEGAGKNVTLVEDSIVAVSAGPEPTLLDLPTIKIWKGAVTNSTTQPDSATTPYKGIAVGTYTPGHLTSATSYIGPTAGGDLEVLWATNKSGNSARYTGAKFDVTNPATDVANIYMAGTSMLNLRATLKGTATTFHFHNVGAIARKTLIFDTQGMTATQTIHVHDAAFVVTASEKMEVKGRVELHGDAMLDLDNTTPFTPDVGTVIVLNDNTAVSVNTGQEAVLEQMTLGTDLIVNSSNPSVYLEQRAGRYDFTGAVSGTPAPKMQQILNSSNLFVNSNNNNAFELDEDLTIGDGKYFANKTSSHKGITIVDFYADGSKIKAAAGASSIGFAMMTTDAGWLNINVPVDAGGGKVVFGSTTALTGAVGTNSHFSQVPVGTVALNRSTAWFASEDPQTQNVPQNAAFINTSVVEVVSGTLYTHTDFTFPTDLALIGGNFNVNNKVVAVDGTLKGTGSWSNGNITANGIVSPGASIGTLSGKDLTIAAGGILEIGIADGPTNDVLNLSGLLALPGAWTLKVVDEGVTDPTGMSWDIINYVGTADALTNVTIVSADFTVTPLVTLLVDDLAGTITLSGLTPGIPGDANKNGFVDDTDLAILLGNWESEPLIISTWALGNFTEISLGDTDVDDNDLAVLLGNWTGPPPAGAAVPEPATLVLLGLGGLSVLRRRRRS